MTLALFDVLDAELNLVKANEAIFCMKDDEFIFTNTCN